MENEKKKRLVELRDSMKAYGYMDGVEELENIFPDLKESEDERIRKWLIDYFDKVNDEVVKEDRLKIIAYLERQKETTSVVSIQEVYRKGFNNAIEAVKQHPEKYGLQEQKYVPHFHEDDSKPQTDAEILTHYLSWAESDEENCPYTWKRLAWAIRAGIDALNQTLPEADTKAFNDGVKEGRRLEREDMQKEQKPDLELIRQSWYTEGYIDGKFKKEPMWNLKTDDGMPRYEKNEKYGQSLEQKSTEWDEEYREEDLRTRFAFYTYKDEDGVLYLSNVFVEETSRNAGFGTKILAAAEKVAETIGAIDIRLKVKQDSPANAWYRKHGYGYMTFEGDYDWLEKTLEYLKPAKSEWSEEDEKLLNYAISMTDDAQVKRFLKSLRPQPQRRDTYYDIIHDILAMLKDMDFMQITPEHRVSLLNDIRVKCKNADECAAILDEPHWKPSEEQIKALKASYSVLKAHDTWGEDEHLPLLLSLYNDLKKYFNHENNKI